MLKKKMLVWLAGLVPVMAWAQTSAGEPEPPRIVLYRLNDGQTAGAAYVFVNGSYHASLVKGDHSALCYRPGKVELRLRPLQSGAAGKDAGAVASLELHEGQIQYLRVKDEAGQSSFEHVPPEQASQDLANTRSRLHAVSRAAQDCSIDPAALGSGTASAAKATSAAPGSR